VSEEPLLPIQRGLRTALRIYTRRYVLLVTLFVAGFVALLDLILSIRMIELGMRLLHR